MRSLKFDSEKKYQINFGLLQETDAHVVNLHLLPSGPLFDPVRASAQCAVQFSLTQNKLNFCLGVQALMVKMYRNTQYFRTVTFKLYVTFICV